MRSAGEGAMSTPVIDEGAFLRQFESLTVRAGYLTDAARTPVVMLELRVDPTRPVWTCTLGTPEQALQTLHALFDAIRATWPEAKP